MLVKGRVRFSMCSIRDGGLRAGEGERWTRGGLSGRGTNNIIIVTK